MAFRIKLLNNFAKVVLTSSGMNIDRRIEAFALLGQVLGKIGEKGSFDIDGMDLSSFENNCFKAISGNSWFTSASVFNMLKSIGRSLHTEDLKRWVGMYDFHDNDPKIIAVIMAGNIPAVGFHDFLSVMISGHSILAKTASDDQYLLPAMAELLISIEPRFSDRITFTTEVIKEFDAVIATGSNNTSRYFNYYFGKYPHIIRKNRNALAVLNGGENQDELTALGDDIFMYYGLGCRNVSKLFIPQDYEIKSLFEAIEDYAEVGDHHKYMNNYDYRKSIFLVNGDPHLDNGFLLLKEDPSMASAVSVLHYERYGHLDEVKEFINRESENIQCVVSIDKSIQGAISPGSSQYPKLWDYADGVDTMKFLLNLSKQ